MFKVGNKVIARRPNNTTSERFIYWAIYMDKYDGAKLTVDYIGKDHIKVKECDWIFDVEWLTKVSKFKGNIK